MTLVQNQDTGLGLEKTLRQMVRRRRLGHSFLFLHPCCPSMPILNLILFVFKATALHSDPIK